MTGVRTRRFLLSEGRVPPASWMVIGVMALVAAALAVSATRQRLTQQVQQALAIDTEKRAHDLMTMTVNSQLIGAIGLVGVTDPEIKREVQGNVGTNASGVLQLLETVGRAYEASGVFLVGRDGVVGSAWYRSGPASTGRNVAFRSYFRIAMQGRTNVYAAIGTGVGERILYYAVPVHTTTERSSPAAGVLVVRVDIQGVQKRLVEGVDNSLLLTPQGLVFAASQDRWVALAAGAMNAQRLQAVRDLKQFGNLFDHKDPQPLPFSVESGIQVVDGREVAVATAALRWNDPQGDWTVVGLKDLAEPLNAGFIWSVGALAGALVLLLGSLLVRLLAAQQARLRGRTELAAVLAERTAEAAFRSRLAETSVRLQQARGLEDLGRVFLTELHTTLEVAQGAVYLRDRRAGGRYRLVGSYACAAPPQEWLEPGVGVLGQCLEDRQLRWLESGPGFNVRLRSGLGETVAPWVVLAPVLRSHQVLGIVELALAAPPAAGFETQLHAMLDLLAINTDITTRSGETQDALKAAQATQAQNAGQLVFQQALIDTIPYPVFYKGTDTRFLGFNRAYEETFAVRRDDLIGKRVGDLEYLPAADRQAYQAEDEATIAAMGVVRRHMNIPLADGRVHRTLYMVSAVRLPDGQAGGLVGSFVDLGPVDDGEGTA